MGHAVSAIAPELKSGEAPVIYENVMLAVGEYMGAALTWAATTNRLPPIEVDCVTLNRVVEAVAMRPPDTPHRRVLPALLGARIPTCVVAVAEKGAADVEICM